jgi:hypothetical protein
MTNRAEALKFNKIYNQKYYTIYTYIIQFSQIAHYNTKQIQGNLVQVQILPINLELPDVMTCKNKEMLHCYLEL